MHEKHFVQCTQQHIEPSWNVELPFPFPFCLSVTLPNLSVSGSVLIYNIQMFSTYSITEHFYIGLVKMLAWVFFNILQRTLTNFLANSKHCVGASSLLLIAFSIKGRNWMVLRGKPVVFCLLIHSRDVYRACIILGIVLDVEDRLGRKNETRGFPMRSLVVF